jgi:ABC-type lipoprotein export system ATPase subunit
MLERVGLAGRARERAGVLSMGEAQRVALARALVNRPAIVLADEPTGSLDSASAAQVLDALREVRETGGALLVVTHDDTVAQRADRSLCMRDGRLIH